MSFSFVENFTVSLPDFTDYEADFSESFSSDKALIIEVAAIHEGLTSNYNFYSAEELAKSLVSWVEPYPKPIILNHDMNSEAIGRVMAAKMDKEEDGSQFIRLQIAITDPVAAQKIIDKRYLTGSVGGRAGKAVCSISGEDLAQESSSGRPRPLRYTRGKVYKGQLAYLKMEEISFKEYSFVNQPADQKSSVRSINTASGDEPVAASDDWVAKSSAFILHMDKEEIFSLEENESLFTGMKKKEYHPAYLGIKGAFLTALAAHENGIKEGDSLLYSDSSQEIGSQENNNMEKVDLEEDILSVAKDLSEDLSSIAAASNPQEGEDEEVVSDSSSEEEESAEVQPDEEAEQQEETSEEVTSEETTSDDAEENSEDESEEAEVQKEENVDSENAEKSEEETESDDSEASADQETEEAEGDEGEDEVSEESEAEASEDELIAHESSDELSQELEELRVLVASLENENTQLKQALHRTLAERVVDTKIGLNLESLDDRETLIADHVTRTASSLADSLRDLAKVPAHRGSVSGGSMPEVASEAEVTDSEKNVVTIADAVESEPIADEDAFEQILVDALMGRRKL